MKHVNEKLKSITAADIAELEQEEARREKQEKEIFEDGSEDEIVSYGDNN